MTIVARGTALGWTSGLPTHPGLQRYTLVPACSFYLRPKLVHDLVPSSSFLIHDTGKIPPYQGLQRMK